MGKKKIIDSHKPFKPNRFKFWAIIIKYWFKSLSSNPLYSKGVHFFEAPSGTGKTLLSNIILQKTTEYNQFWYTNIDQYESEKQVVFNASDLFKRGKQVAKLPHTMEINGIKKYSKGIIFDELNINFNRRMNRTANYNDIFIGLIEMIVSHRHQSLDRLYFLGQSLALQDGQVQQIFRFRHVIFAKKKYNYELYKKKKGVVKTPKKLIVHHYIKTSEYDVNGFPVFVFFKKSKIKVNTEKHLETYNHLGYASKYNALPNFDFDREK